jgi:hypothetical protein
MPASRAVPYLVYPHSGCQVPSTKTLLAGFSLGIISLKESIAYERRSGEYPVFMRVRRADSLLFHCYHLFLKSNLHILGRIRDFSIEFENFTVFFTVIS